MSFCIVAVMSVTVFGQSIEELMNTGNSMLAQGAYSQAISAFRTVIQKEPDYFEAQFNLAFAYLHWGQQQKAVEEFKKALRLNPKSSESYSNLAIAYENLGKSAEALGSLEKAVQMNPSNIPARMNLAAMYANANHYDKAISEYKKAIQYDGQSEEALVNLAKCLVSVNQTAEAKTYFKQVLGVNPNNGEAHWELGKIFWRKENNVDKGIQEFKLAITVNPAVPAYYDDLASAYDVKGNKSDAIETMKKGMAYAEDVLAKDKMQQHLDRIQNGDKKNSLSDNSVVPVTNVNQTNDLKAELRGEQGASKKLDAAPVDPIGDLDELSKDDGPTLDLRGEAKKRAESK